jgi:hypothetical protein
MCVIEPELVEAYMGYEWIPVLKCLVICSDKGMKAAEAQL